MKLRTILAAAALAALTVPASVQAAQPAGAGALKSLTNGVEVGNGVATLRVTALTDGILRVRIARGGTFPEDASWAVPHDVRMKSVPVRATGDGFTTGAVAVHIDPATLALTVTDPGDARSLPTRRSRFASTGAASRCARRCRSTSIFLALGTRLACWTGVDRPSSTGTPTPSASRRRRTRFTNRFPSTSAATARAAATACSSTTAGAARSTSATRMRARSR